MAILNKNSGNQFDIIVIGAGHAGCEAALVSARMGAKTALFFTDITSVAMMPCNPSIGGTGKGHLVREIDALGGEMGMNIDKTFIQSKMLNMSKGPAVHSLRAQADKELYHQEMLKTLREQENLCLYETEVLSILKSTGSVRGVVCHEREYFCKALVISTGTFLRGKVFIGDDVKASGPSNLAAANALSDSLKELGFPLRRFKTGTPARILRNSINYDKMKEQLGDEKIVPFSFMNEGIDLSKEQVSCWLSYTNEKTHQIIRDNIEKSAMYSGNIVGTGPRYCPSIEDKIVRFPDRERHQLFVEPEGVNDELMYIQGMSSSLPYEVQKEFYATIEGLEDAEIVKPAYAIEYDCIDPLSLKPSLESKVLGGCFCAGQFNGSSGYEEAAAQGLIAGINAVQYIKGKEPLVLRRDQAYIGVLIDDLVTKGTNEPYRIMTSRAEYRLLLRQDNADKRLTPIGYEFGSVTQARYDLFCKKYEKINEVVEALLKRKHPDSSGFSEQEIRQVMQNAGKDLSQEQKQAVLIFARYYGYIDKQEREVQKTSKLENKRLPAYLDYMNIHGLRLEAQQKLNQIRPETLGQASRISGVSPSDINVLLIYLEHQNRRKDREQS